MKENGEIKSWNGLKIEFKLEQTLYFKSMNLLMLYKVIGKTSLNIQIRTHRTIFS